MIAANPPKLVDAHGRELFEREERTWGLHEDAVNWGPAYLGANLRHNVHAAYRQNTWVYACIHRKASSLSMIKFKLVSSINPDEEIEFGPVYDLMQRPNPVFEFDDLIQSISIHLDVHGEAHLGIERLPGNRSVRELWPFDPTKLQTLIDQNSDRLLGWEYWEQGRSRRYDLKEIITWRNYNPENKYRGLSPLLPATLAIEQSQSSAVFNNSALKSGGGVGGLYHTDETLTEKQQEQVRCVIQSRYSGPEKAGRPLLLHSGIKYEPTSWSPSDILLDKVVFFSANEICAALDCPGPLVNILDRATYSNIEQISLNFYDTVIQPRAEKIASGLTRWLCEPYQPGTQVIIDTSGIRELAENLTEKVEQAAKLLGLGYTFDEVNERLALQMPDTGDDTRWIMQGLKTLDNAIAPPASPFSQNPAGNAPEDGVDQDQENPEDEQESPSKTLEKAFRRIGKQQNPIRVATWERQHRPFERIERRMRGAIKQYYVELKAAMLKRLDRFAAGEKAPQDPSSANSEELVDFLFDAIGAMVDPLWSRMVGYINLAHATGILQIAEEVPLANRILDGLGLDESASPIQIAEAFQEALQPALEKHLDEEQLKIKQIEVKGPLRKALAETLSEGIVEGDGWQELSDRIKTTFKNENVVNPMRIARTETEMTQSFSRWKAMGVAEVEKVEWLTAKDEAVRESHQLLDGVIRPKGESFLEKASLKFPGDPAGPAEEIINCRCVLVAVIEDED